MDVATARREALDRSLLLFGGLLHPGVGADRLDAHLAGFRVRIIATTGDRSTQTVLATIASLIVRSGMQVIVNAPDLPTTTPLLGHGSLFASLDAHIRDAMPGAQLQTDGGADVTVAVGSASRKADIWIGAGSTEARCANSELAWQPGSELAALGAAGLAASEVHKAALRCLPVRHRTAGRLLQPTAATFDVGIASAPAVLGQLVMISGGAITSAALWTLLAIPNLRAHVRVWDDDSVALSNLNRCLLFGMRHLGDRKVDALATWSRADLVIEPVPMLFGAGDSLNGSTLVGADRIDARHHAQAARPPFLVVGATEGADIVLVSEHQPADPCAACLHPPHPVALGPVPTASFVSFWAGFLAAVRLLRAQSGQMITSDQQVTRCYPLQPQSLVQEAIARRSDCGLCGADAA
ncbi:MAG: ThiF family adenylyltransferase [Chloroflexota bacterium]|nr:ThiF family adenylyltransferase [Chloroflexota bacterium]